MADDEDDDDTFFMMKLPEQDEVLRYPESQSLSSGGPAPLHRRGDQGD